MNEVIERGMKRQKVTIVYEEDRAVIRALGGIDSMCRFPVDRCYFSGLHSVVATSWFVPNSELNGMTPQSNEEIEKIHYGPSGKMRWPFTSSALTLGHGARNVKADEMLYELRRHEWCKCGHQQEDHPDLEESSALRIAHGPCSHCDCKKFEWVLGKPTRYRSIDAEWLGQ